jgi:hypothetical protein
MRRMSASRAGTRHHGADPDAGRRTERVLAAERRIGAVAHVLDDLVAVPGTRSRIGLDPIIGLVPFLGDIVTSLVAAWIVIEAARFHLPGVVIARMVVNASIDFIVGLVPFLGDLFDAAFKANTRNLELFHRHAVDPGASTAGSTAFVLGIVAVFAGVAWLGIVLVGRLLSIVI